MSDLTICPKCNRFVSLYKYGRHLSRCRCNAPRERHLEQKYGGKR